jgi:CRP-like cAMP-binding protein
MSSSKGSNFVTANKILSALPPQEYAHFFSHLELVTLARGKILYDFAEPISSAFFMLSGMVSLLSITEDGSTTQVSMVGSEGVIGIPLVLRVNKAPYRMMVQIPGKAMRARAELFAREFNRGGPLQDIVLRYIHALITQIAQSAACNRFHTVEERLSRWLLISHDRIKSDTLHLTQEALSHMLGATRTNVTAAANALKKKRVIDYRRGDITIIDRKRLEAIACECYKIVTAEIDYLRAA